MGTREGVESKNRAIGFGPIDLYSYRNPKYPQIYTTPAQKLYIYVTFWYREGEIGTEWEGPIRL